MLGSPTSYPNIIKTKYKFMSSDTHDPGLKLAWVQIYINLKTQDKKNHFDPNKGRKSNTFKVLLFEKI